jgi:hypothetical protein
MKKTSSGKRRARWLFYCAAPLILSAGLLCAARSATGWAEWYAAYIYPIFPYTLGRLFAWLPFSLFEFLLLALGIGVLLLPGLALAALFNPAFRRGDVIFRHACFVFCVLFLLFTLTAGINYNRKTFAALYNLPLQTSTPEELRALYEELTAEAAANASASYQTSAAWREEARRAMISLSHKYYTLVDYYPPPKPVMLSVTMSRLGISGVFSPFTLEANYNRDMPDFQIPCAMCHELAHLSGYMREDEANFIAYLACRESPVVAFRYSGAMFALGHVLNAFRAVTDAEQYKALLDELPAAAAADFQRAGAYWRQYEGRAAKIQTKINDAYLRANAQAAGAASYSLVVDLLLAERRAALLAQANK